MLSFIFFLNDVSNYCEERKIKLLINVDIKISRNFTQRLVGFWHSSGQLTFLYEPAIGTSLTVDITHAPEF